MFYNCRFLLNITVIFCVNQKLTITPSTSHRIFVARDDGGYGETAISPRLTADGSYLAWADSRASLTATFSALM